ncbi:MAG: hypothetical protein E7543_06680 [Ruminococcaceae bacterium]|nr:hypothetical protein [Oscillospiraceae bacterium]
MTTWKFNATEYTERTFDLIPEGDHRVRINGVKEKVFSTGNEGFEITFDVSGSKSKLWYYLVLDPRESVKTNQRLGMFFDSFAIRDYDLSHYDDWIGRDGAVRVRHNVYNGSKTANVAFCLSRNQQNRLYVSKTDRYDSYSHNTKTQPTSSGIRPELELNGFSF